MKAFTKRALAVALSALMILGIFAVMSTAAFAQEDTIEGGLILHCWCWNFNNIKKNIPQIAEAGYSAVQTSPINAVFEGEDGGMQLYGDGKWYYQYQPTNYTIGNYQLGTEEEFKAMCEEAHKYGVKVIVDVVANHTTAESNKSEISNALMFIEGGLHHNYDGSKDRDSRKSVTQWYDGLWDANTQNPKYQQIILNFLKTAVADGADGFRYDTAKHIELPDDDPEYASEFWPTVLDNGSEFQYGEVLQGANSNQQKATRFADYAKIMHVTASSYGYTIRKYLDDISGRVSGAVAVGINGLKNPGSESVTDDRLVTWVESHDTYANGGAIDPGKSSYWITQEQINRGWAIITARGDTTSLFFSRPKGSTSTFSMSRTNSVVWGDNKIGEDGDGNYFSKDVVEFNKFHNLMKGETTEMYNLARNKAFVQINRGSKGVAFINNSPSADMEISVETALPEGTYTNHLDDTKFVSKGGILTGKLEPGKMAAIYNSDGYYSPEIPEDTTEPVTETTEPVTETETETVTATETTEPVTETQTATDTTTAEPTESTTVAPTTTSPATAAPSTSKTDDSSKTVVPAKKTVLKKNPAVIKAVKSKKLKAKALKKKKATAKLVTVTNAKGEVKIAKVKKGTSKKLYKKIKVSKNGKITFKKGKYKKGTYKLKLSVTLKGNSEYLSASVNKTVKIKIK